MQQRLKEMRQFIGKMAEHGIAVFSTPHYFEDIASISNWTGEEKKTTVSQIENAFSDNSVGFILLTLDGWEASEGIRARMAEIERKGDFLCKANFEDSMINPEWTAEKIQRAFDEWMLKK